MKMSAKLAIEFINKHGALLVFPVNNKKQPPSLWSQFFPRTPMRWEWDEGGDNRVGNLWFLREELSRSEKVIYTKWYQGRATFFSREVFVALMTILKTTKRDSFILGPEAAQMLEILEMDSPLSTKELKEAADLKGRFYEGQYTRGLKELWSRLLIVAFGERDDGAFPSLLMGSTKNLFEDLYEEASRMSLTEAQKVISRKFPEDSLFLKYLKKITAPKGGKSEVSNLLTGG